MVKDANRRPRKRRLDPDILEHIEAIRNEQPFTGLSVDGESPPYRLKIIGRGELAYYEEGGHALLFELVAGQGILFQRTMRTWSDGRPVDDVERARIVKRFSDYLRSKGAESITVV